MYNYFHWNVNWFEDIDDTHSTVNVPPPIDPKYLTMSDTIITHTTHVNNYNNVETANKEGGGGDNEALMLSL